ncbi:universal stress protein [Ureibacillus manganicus]
MSYKKIAVAIDFSDQSKRAFHRAINIAIENDATLQLAHVVDTKSFGSIAAYDLKYAEKLKEKSVSDIENYKNEAKAAGVKNVEVFVGEGSTKTILTQLLDVDLIICGATGYNAIEKMLIGSVAERIVRQAKYDVLVVRS